MSNGFIYVVDAHFIDKKVPVEKNDERLERRKCMPCVVGRIYLAGSLVVLERGRGSDAIAAFGYDVWTTDFVR
jgi:hypothetical protein